MINPNLLPRRVERHPRLHPSRRPSGKHMTPIPPRSRSERPHLGEHRIRSGRDVVHAAQVAPPESVVGAIPKHNAEGAQGAGVVAGQLLLRRQGREVPEFELRMQEGAGRAGTGGAAEQGLEADGCGEAELGRGCPREGGAVLARVGGVRLGTLEGEGCEDLGGLVASFSRNKMSGFTTMQTLRQRGGSVQLTGIQHQDRNTASRHTPSWPEA